MRWSWRTPVSKASQEHARDEAINLPLQRRRSILSTLRQASDAPEDSPASAINASGELSRR